MGAVGMVAQGHIRRRWRGVLLLAVLLGVVTAVTLSTAAGARRTASSLTRFREKSRSADVELAVPGKPTPLELRELSKTVGVEAVASLRAYGLVVPRVPDLEAIGAVIDTKFGVVVDRDRVVAGRAADPSAADEIAVGEGLAARLHVGVGGHLDAESYSPSQIAAILGGRTEVGPLAGPTLRLRIVGIERRPLDLSDRAAAGGLLVLTRAFDHSYAGRIGLFGTRLRIRTRHGSADTPTVIAAARRIFGETLLSTQGLDVETAGARDAIHVLALALWIFALVAGLAGAVAVGTVLTREIISLSPDQEVLHALGLTRLQRVAIAGPPTLLSATGGAVIAVLGALAVSARFPIGVARRADPEVGVHADWLVLGLGTVAMVAFVLSVAALAALRVTGRRSIELAPRWGRSGISLAGVERRGLPPAAANGLRMALEPGRGSRAVPVRSAFLAGSAGVLGLTAALLFASSLGHLAATPRLYGWNWDFRTADTTSNSPCGADDYGLTRTRGVAAVAEVCYQNVQLDGRPVAGLAITSLRGAAIDPVLTAGRAPQGPREVALGSTTLHALGKRIGDTVHVSGRRRMLTYEIVGRAVFPTLGQAQPLADGVAFTGAGFSPLFDQNIFSRYFVGRFDPDTDQAAVERRIAAIRNISAPRGPAPPIEVTRLQQIRWVPTLLATLLVGLALLAVGHALVTAVRRRRRELAVLRTLGFDRRQVRATIAWQATTLAAVALLLGIPIGLAAGNFVWRLVAQGLGVSTTTVIPRLGLLATIPAAIFLVNLVAFLPARAAARIRPAVALRSE